MSQFFWKVKLWVLLNHLFSDRESSDLENVNSGDADQNADQKEQDNILVKQLKCLEEWIAEAPPASIAFPKVEVKSRKNSGFMPQHSVSQYAILPQSIPPEILTCSDARKTFWWFWRCYPEFVENSTDARDLKSQFDEDRIWSQTISASALRAAELGYFTRLEDYSNQKNYVHPSHPYLAHFAFTPIPELIQAIDTVQDVQTGFWLSHYLAARICWRIAWKYGPDIFVSPGLYAQPLIDYWLLQQYPEFSQWISAPTERLRSRAGFPNSMMLILPDNGCGDAAKGNPVWATMIHAEQALKQEWLRLSQQTLNLSRQQNFEPPPVSLQESNGFLESDRLEALWQSYWVALPIPDRSLSVPIAPPVTPSPASAKLPPQQNLIDQIQQQLEIARYSQVWKIPTAFSLRSDPAAVAFDLHDPALTPNPLRDSAEAVAQGSTASRIPDAFNSLDTVLRGLPCCPVLTPGSGDRRKESPGGWRLFAMGGAAPETANQENHPASELAAYAADRRPLTDFSHHLLPYLVEQRYGGQLLYASDRELLLSGKLKGSGMLQDWEQLLWDIHQCFKGEVDPAIERFTLWGKSPVDRSYFTQQAGSWHWQGNPDRFPRKLLTTPNRTTSPGFGLVIAHPSVPLPLVLQNLQAAKTAVHPVSDFFPFATCSKAPFKPFSKQIKPSGIQVRVMYRNGSMLTATSEWNAFNQWRSLIGMPGVNAAVWEQIARRWKRNSPPSAAAISLWVTTISADAANPRTQVSNNLNCISESNELMYQSSFWMTLTHFLERIWRSIPDYLCETDQQIERDRQILGWLNLAAFILRDRFSHP